MCYFMALSTSVAALFTVILISIWNDNWNWYLVIAIGIVEIELKWNV